jgi:maltooligosyltrehalose trehalohydrolase
MGVSSCKLPIGAELCEGGVQFRVWAPAWRRVTLVIEGRERHELALRAEQGGYHAVFFDHLGAGARYRFRLGDKLYADPASRYQPEGPFGPSEIVDPADTVWTDARWHGVTRPHEQVIYEMHVGTFTPQGTWAAGAEQLPFLADLGITTIRSVASSSSRSPDRSGSSPTASAATRRGPCTASRRAATTASSSPRCPIPPAAS